MPLWLVFLYYRVPADRVLLWPVCRENDQILFNWSKKKIPLTLVEHQAIFCTKINSSFIETIQDRPHRKYYRQIACSSLKVFFFFTALCYSLCVFPPLVAECAYKWQEKVNINHWMQPSGRPKDDDVLFFFWCNPGLIWHLPCSHKGFIGLF